MATWLYHVNFIAKTAAWVWSLPKPATAAFAIAANAAKNSIGGALQNAIVGEKSENSSKKIDVYGLTTDEIQQLRQIAKERYGKASVSLLAKKLLQAQIRQPEITNTHEEQLFERLTLRLPPKQQVYLTQKAKEQHSTLNEVA